MENFEALGLPMPLTRALARMEFTTPTPIQAQAIPHALEGRDILGSAQTGTGKTGAFGIPLVSHLLENPESTALVMAPTRELASQVMQTMQQLLGGKGAPIKTALIIGGEPISKQFYQLQAKPRIIVGTPGRINDHLRRGKLNLSRTDFLVLDETDRMLDMGFSEQIETILQRMPEQRQTLLFSATLPKHIVRLTDTYLKDPVRISVGQTGKPAANIKQDTINLKHHEKYSELLDQLNSRDGSIIVFVNTKRSAESMADELYKAGHMADAMHGDLRHNKRERVLQNFRKGKHRIMVATDIAARGLDIPHIEHVINYDLPACPEDYIHRIGRTARAGAEGSALCLISPGDRNKWRAIERLLNPNAANDRNDDRRHGGRPQGNRGYGNKGGSYGQKRSFGSGKPQHRDSREERPYKSNSAGGGKLFRKSRPERDGEDRFERSSHEGGRRSDFRSDNNRRSDARPEGNRRSEGKPFRKDRPERSNDQGNRRSGFRSDDNRRSNEDRRPSFRSDDSRRSDDNRRDDNRRSNFRSDDNRGSHEDRRSNYRSEGRPERNSRDGERSQSRPDQRARSGHNENRFEGERPSGQKPQGKKFSGNKDRFSGNKSSRDEGNSNSRKDTLRAAGRKSFGKPAGGSSKRDGHGKPQRRVA